MNKMIRKMVAIVAIFAIAFTCAPVAMGTSEADAASAPGMVKTLKMKAGYNYVTLNWSKVSSKNLKGYTIYRGGKVLKHVGAKTVSYKDTKVKASTKYTYFVKAYTTYKQKQYYNSKTKKWQAKKPAAKNWKGKKTRTATVKKYGKASPKLTIKTTAKPKATGGSKKTGSSWSYAMDVDKDSKSIEFGLNKVTANTEVRIYRGSKKIGFLKDTKSTAKDAGLKADTEYTYTVKIYHKGNLAKTKTLKYSTTKAEKTTGGQSSSSSTEGTSDGNNNNGNNNNNTDNTNNNDNNNNNSNTDNGNTSGDNSGSDNSSTTNPWIKVGLEVSHNEVKVSWKAYEGATGFEVYRNNTKIATKGANDTEYTDTDVKADTTYTYKVVALEGSAKKVQVKTEITTQKAPQTGGLDENETQLKADASFKIYSDKVELSWTKNFDAAGIEIYRDGVLIKSLSGTATGYTDANLSASTTYNYQIKFKYSEDVALTLNKDITTAAKPSQQTTGNEGGTTGYERFIRGHLQPSGKSVKLTWEANDEASGFNIYRDGEKIAELDASAREYTDKGLEWNTTYSYKIEALDDNFDALVVEGRVSTGTQPRVRLSWSTSDADSYVLYKNNSKIKTFTNADASNGTIVYDHYVDSLDSSDVYKLEIIRNNMVTATLTFQ